MSIIIKFVIIFLANIFFRGINNLLLAQNTIEKQLEGVIENQFTDDKAEGHFDQVINLYHSPLNLNQTSRESLEALSILSNTELDAFFHYRTTFGLLYSIYELQAIPGLTMTTIRSLLPFVSVGQAITIESLWTELKNNTNTYLMYRTDKVIQERKGYSNESNAYLGSPYKHLIRYRNSSSRTFSIGCTIEKDAGEQVKWSPTEKIYFADFLSGHVALFNKRKLKALLLGDYTMQVGQGLVLGGGFSLGKSSESILSVKRSSKGILPYSSVMESGFFRGIAMTLALTKSSETTLFFSYTKRDAKLSNTSLNNSQFSSFNVMGMHRTVAELAIKKTVAEMVVGANHLVRFDKRKAKVGLSFVQTYFDQPLIEVDRIYNRFDFKGNQQSIVGLDFSKVIQNNTFFGELAITSNRSKGFVLGYMAALSQQLDVALIFRNYEKTFHSFYSSAFSEGSSQTNEKGAYLGLKLKLSGKWSMTSYYDYFIFPWLRFLKDSPTEGYGYMARITYLPSKKTSLYFQLRGEEQAKNQVENITPIDFAVPSQKYTSILNLDSKIGSLSFRSRVQWSGYKQSNGFTQGTAIVQDVSLDSKRVRLSTRYALFETDDFENRQYVYEKDVLYAVSFPAYYGSGIRTYLIVQLKLGKQLDVWIRYARTRYDGRTTISSGLEEIQGNVIEEVKVQLRLKL